MVYTFFRRSSVLVVVTSFLVSLRSTSPMVSATAVSLDSHSVVQVMAYDAIYGIYPVLRWWWSASVINDKWVILTNNHVVTTTDGRELPLFVVCVADTVTSIPRCDYVASIISRDEKKDVALLQIATKDIVGNNTSYTSFTPLVLDYDYLPQPQDQTVAVWFPGIGGNTMTQTVGVVAGVQTYNDATYIKTDTLIAPGNSGWPLLFDGKQIGVNTFTYGYGDSLSYALSMGEIQSWIADALTEATPETVQSLNPQTLGYIKTMYQANQTKKVSDRLFSFTLPEWYVINSYIPGVKLAWQKESPDSTSVQNFLIKLSQYPLIGSGKTQRDMFLRQYYGYDPNYMKIETVTIGGIDFISFVSKRDVNQWNADPYKYYIAILDDHHVIDLSLYAGWVDWSKQIKEVQEQIKAFTTHIWFTKNYQLQLPQGDISFVNPVMTVRYSSWMVFNIIDGEDIFARYGRWWWNILGTLSIPISSKVHEKITVNVAPRTISDGINQTIDELYAIKTESISPQNKTRLTLRGNQGFAYCMNTPSSMYSMGRASFAKSDTVMWPWWSPIAMGVCRVELYLWAYQDYIVYVDLFVERANLTKYQRNFLSRVTKILSIPSQWDGVTIMPTRIMQPKKTPLAGAEEQSADFQNLLAYLQYNNLIPNTYTKLSQPLTYRQYIELMSTMVYGEKAYVEDVAKKSMIWPDTWMNSSSMRNLDTVIGFTMAGVEFSTYSPKHMVLLETLKDTTYKDQRQLYNTYLLWLCDGEQKQMNIYGYYTPYQSYMYSPRGGLVSYEPYPSTWSIAKPSVANYPKELQQCLNAKSYTARCGRLMTEYMLMDAQRYSVLTLGEAINNIFPKINMCLVEKKNKKS